MHDTGGPDELLESLRKTKTENYVHGDNSSIPGQLCFMLKVVLVPAFTLHGWHDSKYSKIVFVTLQG